jgi:hypothetical protein
MLTPTTAPAEPPDETEALAHGLPTARSPYSVAVSELDAPKAEWVINLPSGPPEKDALARLVDADGGRDDAENSYYEAAADPDFVRVEATRRRFRGQYLRRLRHLALEGRHLSNLGKATRSTARAIDV